MDFRELINKIDSINSEAKKEPERLAFADAIDHVKDIKFTPPLPSGIKFSSANNVKFKGQDINDPKVKLALFQDELKNSPARLLGEIGSRIKPTSDEQMDLSGHIAAMGEKLASGSNQLGSLSEPEKKLAIEAIKAALRGMELERDPDQSEYKDGDGDEEMESSLPWKKYETSVKEEGIDPTTGKEQPKTVMGFNVRSKEDKIKDKKSQIELAKRNAPKSGLTSKDVPQLEKELASLMNEGDNIYHSCVKSFKHEKFGEGTVLHGEHTLSESGEVSHYDAKFVREDGSQFIVRNIPVANMKECVVVEHGHPKKKKKVKEEEVVDEAHYQDWKRKTIPVNKEIKLAGDSIWDKEGTNPKSVNVKEVEVTFEIDTESDDAEDRDTTYVSVQVEHDGPWKIYTDTGFESAISQMIGIDVEFTEQGMQDDGEASLEGSVATKDIPANAKPLESIKQQKTVEDDSGKDRDSVKPEMVKGVAEKIKAEYVDELRTYMDRKKDVVQQLKSSGITDPKEIEREIDDMDDDILSYYFPGDIKGKIEVMNSVLNLGPDADGHDIVDLVHNSGMDTSPREEIADQFQNELKKADPETFKKLYGNTQTISDVEQEDWFQGQTAVTLEGDEFYETFGWIGENDENIEEAEYQGRTVKLNKPMRGDVKKFKVYVKNPKGNTVKVNFGDPDMKIKKSNPARRRSFRARHNCDTPGPKHKARYWSCRKW